MKQKFATWEEAIAYSGGLLLERGKVTQKYIEAMIENIKTLGPYISIAPNIAMPHARPEDGVNEKGISVVVLKEPVFIGGEADKQARILICLAATDANSHIKLIQTIAEWLSDEQFIQQMLEVETEERLHELLQKYYF